MPRKRKEGTPLNPPMREIPTVASDDEIDAEISDLLSALRT
jgi:hypothetical protein